MSAGSSALSAIMQGEDAPTLVDGVAAPIVTTVYPTFNLE
jgi:hypothetical protein